MIFNAILAALGSLGIGAILIVWLAL